MSKQDKQNIASVIACEKQMVPSDALMFATIWDIISTTDDITKYLILELQEKAVRGTISNRLKKAVAGDPMKLNDKVENANLQRVDYCSLPQDQDTLVLRFTLKFLGNIKNISACNNAGFKLKMQQAIASYIDKYGFTELAKRYACNLANSRFLWRNRVGAEHLKVNIKVLNESKEQDFSFDASDFSLKDFDSNNKDLNDLSKLIAGALSSNGDFLLLQVTAYAKVGKGQEVYPSEELVLDKNTGKGGKSKVLYKVAEQAAMHSQKIGNALRTIDTWYPQDENEDIPFDFPIAAEPYGAVTTIGKAFRNPKNKKDFYTLFDAWVMGATLSEEDAHFVMAILVRGGVFGESSKES